MIVKAVIRAGAGLFERDDGYFLIGNGSSGTALRHFTRERLQLALHGLREVGIDHQRIGPISAARRPHAYGLPSLKLDLLDVFVQTNFDTHL